MPIVAKLLEYRLLPIADPIIGTTLHHTYIVHGVSDKWTLMVVLEKSAFVLLLTIPLNKTS